jgi:hypothetical protein
MLRSTWDLVGSKIDAVDGSIGSVHDLLFDDTAFAVRYLHVDTGGWLPGRQVLISPEAVDQAELGEEAVPVDLTKEQVKDSPGIATDKPVSRQHEQALADYYGWVPYWSPTTLPMASWASEMHARKELQAEAAGGEDASFDPHLRSMRALRGYAVSASDGSVGQLDDFILDTEAWLFRYLVVDVGHWLAGRRVLVAPDWMDPIDWEKSKVHLNLTREEIKGSPEFDPRTPVNRRYELRLYDYYGRPAYWQKGDNP